MRATDLPESFFEEVAVGCGPLQIKRLSLNVRALTPATGSAAPQRDEGVEQQESFRVASGSG